ncbi:MAG: hypothetical protein EOP05_21595 [Proteobacteria bacterium]|nr:MAG: hypothetical protein EOP05_21595 [Pseudomonadota bacterium]
MIHQFDSPTSCHLNYRRQGLSIYRALIPLSALFLALALAGCGSDNDNEGNNRKPAGKTVLETNVGTYEIRPYKEPCQREPRDFCLVGDDGSGVAKRMYSDIEGLPYVWGRIRTAEIQADRVEDTPGGQQRYEYKLVRLLTDLPMPALTQFEINVDQNDVAASESCEFQLLDEVSFKAPDTTVCAKMNTELNTGLPTRAVFSFTGNEAAPIELIDTKSPIIPAK